MILLKTTQKINKLKLNENQLKIIELIKENPYITRKQIAVHLDITSYGVKYNLKKLTDKELSPNLTCKNFLQVPKEGNINVKR